MSTILILGIIAFSISCIYFIINPKKDFNSAFLVSLVTLFSYFIMLQGNFVNDDLYWTRWIFYGVSCPLLAYEISRKIELELPKRIFNIFLTVITMVTGAAASYAQGNYKLAFFGLSTFAFVYLLVEFYKTKSKALSSLTPYIVFGWCVFPLVFLLSNEGFSNVISLEVAGSIYLVLDIFTKIVFYIHHSKIKLLTEI
jgi:bacteriorhodopsin